MSLSPNKSLRAGASLKTRWLESIRHATGPVASLRLKAGIGENAIVMKKAVNGWLRHDATGLAAALSYYAAFSLAPLILIAISISAIVFGEEASRGAVQSQLSGALGAKAAELVENMVNSAGKSGANGTMAVVGFATLLISAGSVFNQLKESLNRIWEVPWKDDGGVWDFLKVRIISTAMVLGTGLLMLTSLIASTAITAAFNYVGTYISGSVILLQIANPILSLAIFTVVFAAIFRILPDVSIRWKDVWSGGLLTAILFTVGKAALAAYLGREGTASTYGAAGAMMLVLLWVYYSSLILLFGAEYTAAHAEHRREKRLPVPDAATH
ncbi:MAG: ribonuclease [Akkermansiaceae bacterium]|nr:ribonuclease [Akkermansiaceae bacterium]